MIVKYFLILFFCVLTEQLNSELVYSNTNHIRFLTKQTTCNVNENSCKIPVFILNSKNKRELLIRTNGIQFVKFLKIESCIQNNVDIDVTLKEECNKSYSIFESLNTTDSDIELVFINFKPRLVSKSTFELEYRSLRLENGDDEFYTHDIEVVESDSITNKIFEIYILIGQIIISVILGSILHANHTIKFFQLSSAAVIGFWSQFFIFPIVCIFFSIRLLLYKSFISSLT